MAKTEYNNFVKKKFFITVFSIILFSIITFVAIEISYIKRIPSFENFNCKEYLYNIFFCENEDTYMHNMLTKTVNTESPNITPAFRPDENIHSPKKAVIFSVCSYAYGFFLDENQTISALTAKLTGRPVYSRAGNGWGLDELYYMSKEKAYYDSIQTGEPEYIFYIMIKPHERTLNHYKSKINSPAYKPTYIIKNNKLIQKHGRFYENFYFINHIRDIIYNITINQNREKMLYPKIRLYLTERAKEIHKHWPDTKLVILYYPENKDSVQYDVWDNIQSLKNEGYYDLLNLNDVVNDIYKYNKYWHPTSEVWEKVVPELIKRYNL